MKGRLCTISNCNDRHFAHGLCNRHYMRVRRRGTTADPTRPTTEERFWSYVDRTGPDDCWPWGAGKFASGYGAFALSHRENIRAHRYAYELTHGQLEAEQVVRHRCDNPPCCNPNHLLAGSHQDNIDDRNRRGRQAKGERMGTAKLSDQQVVAIRSDLREQRVIAADYGVCKSTIGYIKRGENWRHL